MARLSYPLARASSWSFLMLAYLSCYRACLRVCMSCCSVLVCCCWSESLSSVVTICDFFRFSWKTISEWKVRILFSYCSTMVLYLFSYSVTFLLNSSRSWFFSARALRSLSALVLSALRMVYNSLTLPFSLC